MVIYKYIYICGQQKKGHQLSKVGQVNSLFHGTPYTYGGLCQTFDTNHCGRLNLNPDQVKFICFGHRERDCISGVVHSGIKFWLKLDQYVSDIWSTTCAYDWWACFMEVMGMFHGSACIEMRSCSRSTTTFKWHIQIGMLDLKLSWGTHVS